MNLYIETENGAIKNHPAFEDNLMQAFGEIPAHWEPFTRVERPTPDIYQVLESQEAVYAKVDGVWTDVWTVRDMTVEEKEAVQQNTRNSLSTRDQAENWSAWTLDEATNTMVPPIPRPAPDQTKLDQRIFTFWCGADANWKDTPVRPEGNYKFDFLAWDWVQVVDSTPV
jgi:hypothetical protein